MLLKYVEMKWAPLAWIAECIPGNPEVSVHHGSRVETQENFFVEGVWDGEFSHGGIGNTESVFGSCGSIDKSGRSITIPQLCQQLHQILYQVLLPRHSAGGIACRLAH